MEMKTKISRSFSFKVNLGNYQTADFFCSQESECLEQESEVLEKSQALEGFCRQQVMLAVNKFKREFNQPATPMSDKERKEKSVEIPEL